MTMQGQLVFLPYSRLMTLPPGFHFSGVLLVAKTVDNPTSAHPIGFRFVPLPTEEAPSSGAQAAGPKSGPYRFHLSQTSLRCLQGIWNARMFAMRGFERCRRLIEFWSGWFSSLFWVSW